MQIYYSRIWLCLLLAVTSLYSYEIKRDLKSFTRINCTLKPIIRATQRKDTNKQKAVKRGTSTNWSGYVAAKDLQAPDRDSVKHVEGMWVAPDLDPLDKRTYCSIWVGIDGYGSDTVEQLGTEHSWINGRQVNYAWFEMYPDYAYEISKFPVNVGDVISASVTYLKNGVFALAIKNHTKKVYTVIPKSRTTSKVAKRVSAEWVVEAPYSNKVLPLSDFDSVKFRRCSAMINGVFGAIKNSHWEYDALQMATARGVLKAVPSKLGPGGKGFSVEWKHT
jgi:hypothetical protein